MPPARLGWAYTAVGLHESSRLQASGSFRDCRPRLFPQPDDECLLDHYATRLAGERSEDVAAAAQQRLEDVVIGLVRPFIERTRLRNLALAGGVFANVKVNQRLFELVGVDKIFIHPNMGDGVTRSAAHSTTLPSASVQTDNSR